MIRLAIVGTGGMAGAHANEFKKIKGVKLVAACDVVRDKALAFAAKFGIPAVYDRLDQMLREAEIDAVTNVTPDAAHAPVSLQIIAAGKHVLCEKPLATCYVDAKKMADAAKRRGVINMVNLSYRNSSAINKAHALVQAGAIGDVKHVEAHYLQGWLASAHWGDWHTSPALLWRLSTKHGSRGVLGDLGVHIFDFTDFGAGGIAGVYCRLKAFPKAKNNRIGEYVFDANDSVVATIELANGALGTVTTTRWAPGQANSLLLRIHGDKGGIVVDLDAAWDSLRICRGKDIQKVQWQTVKCGRTPNIYQRFVRSIQTGKNDQPDFARGARIQKVLDACFTSERTGKMVRV